MENFYRPILYLLQKKKIKHSGNTIFRHLFSPPLITRFKRRTSNTSNLYHFVSFHSFSIFVSRTWTEKKEWIVNPCHEPPCFSVYIPQGSGRNERWRSQGSQQLRWWKEYAVEERSSEVDRERVARISLLGKTTNREMQAFRRKYESQIADAFSHRYSSGIIALHEGGTDPVVPSAYIYIPPLFRFLHYRSFVLLLRLLFTLCRELPLFSSLSPLFNCSISLSLSWKILNVPRHFYPDDSKPWDELNLDHIITSSAGGRNKGVVGSSVSSLSFIFFPRTKRGNLRISTIFGR